MVESQSTTHYLTMSESVLCHSDPSQSTTQHRFSLSSELASACAKVSGVDDDEVCVVIPFATGRCELSALTKNDKK